jgi:endonuclease YncB( thermonuclease family)
LTTLPSDFVIDGEVAVLEGLRRRTPQTEAERRAPIDRGGQQFRFRCSATTETMFQWRPVLPAVLLCLVVRITDGDTLKARCDDQTINVRLAEVDAPEKGLAFGNRSRQALGAL